MKEISADYTRTLLMLESWCGDNLNVDAETMDRVQIALELMRTYHKHGEEYYWVLYYSFLSPQRYEQEQIIVLLQAHGFAINEKTYLTCLQKAIMVLSEALA